MYHFLNTLNLFAPGLLVWAHASLSLRPPASGKPTEKDEGHLFSPSFWSFSTLFAALVISVVIISLLAIITLELAVFRLTVLEGCAGVLNGVLALGLGYRFWKRRKSLEALCFPLPVPENAKTQKPLIKINRRAAAWTAMVGLLLLAALAVRFPVSRYAYGGQDQGTYVIMAQMFQRTGRIGEKSKLVSRIESSARLAPLRRAYTHFSTGSRLTVPGRYEGGLLPGFYLADRQAGKIVPQFFHLHPAWMTIWGWLWGSQYAAYSLLLFSFLGLCAVWYLGRWALADRWAGLLALAFFAFQILQVWTARYPLSEIPSQTFLLCSLTLLAYALRGRATARLATDRFGDAHKNQTLTAAAVGGLCLGLTFFVRITAVYLVPVLALCFLFFPGRRRDQRSIRVRVFFYSAFLTFAWALVHNYTFSFPYVYDLVRKRLDYLLRFTPTQVASSVLLGFTLLVVAKELLFDGVAAEHKKRLLRWLERYAWLWATLAVGALAAALAYNLALKPVVRFVGGKPDKIQRIVQLAAFVSWPAIGVGFFGLALLVARSRFFPRTLLGILGLSIAPLVLLWPLRNRYAYYYCRYFVSELLPFLLLGLAHGLSFSIRRALGWAQDAFHRSAAQNESQNGPKNAFRRGTAKNGSPNEPQNAPPLRSTQNTCRGRWSKNSSFRRRQAGRLLLALTTAVTAAVLTFYLHGHFTNLTYRKVELAHSWDTVNKIAAQFPKDAVVVMGRRPRRYRMPSFRYMIGTALQCGYGIETLLLNRLGKLPPSLHDLGRPLFLFQAGPSFRPAEIQAKHLLIPISGGLLPYKHSNLSVYPPKQYRNLWFRYYLYRILDATDFGVSPGQKAWVSQTAGFYPWEDGHAWTKAKASAKRIPVPAQKPLSLTIVLHGLFPKQVSCPVTVRVDGTTIHHQIHPGAELAEERKIGPLTVPAKLNDGSIDIEIDTCTWKPTEIRSATDPRALGLDVEEIRVRLGKPGESKPNGKTTDGKN